MGEDELKARLLSLEHTVQGQGGQLSKIERDLGETSGKIDTLISLQMSPKPSANGSSANDLAVNTTNKTFSFLEKVLTVAGGALAGYFASKG